MREKILYSFQKYQSVYILSSVIFILFIVFHPTFFNYFTNWDDGLQIYENEDIKSLSFDQIVAIFQSSYVGMYQPFTTLLYSFEYTIFGLKPTGYHFVSLFIHCLNAVLVYFMLSKFSSLKWQNFFITLIFALHPFQVEAVAWVSARSTLLSTFFILISIISYVKFCQIGRNKHYYMSILFFLFSLLSKSIGMYLPFLLFILDYYFQRKPLKKVIIEKLPFFLLAILFGIITIYFRIEIEEVKNISKLYTPLIRFFIVLFAIWIYISKSFYPNNFSTLYTYPYFESGNLPTNYYYCGGIILVLFLILVFAFIRLKKYRKNLLLFLSIFLLPILPTLPVYSTMKYIAADRFMYLPIIGIAALIAGTINLLQKSKNIRYEILVAASFFILLYCGVQSYSNTKTWKNSLTLWNTVIRENRKSSEAWMMRGIYHKDNKEYMKAMLDFTRSLELNPYKEWAYAYRGTVNGYLNDYIGVVEDCTKALFLDSTIAIAWSDRANAWHKLEEYKKSIHDCNKAIELDSTYSVPWFVKGNAVADTGNIKGAIPLYDKALRLYPYYKEAWFIRGMAKIRTGDTINGCNDLKSAEMLGYKWAGKKRKEFCK